MFTMWEEKAPYDWWKVEKHFGCFFSACCPFSGSLIRCGNTRLRWRRLFWTLSGWTVLQLSGNPGNPKQQAHTGTNNIIELFIHYIAAHMTTSGLHAHVSCKTLTAFPHEAKAGLTRVENSDAVLLSTVCPSASCWSFKLEKWKMPPALH